MARLKALLWDVDGTIAETERDGHRVAFNLAIESHGLPWHWDELHYADLLHTTGGRERLLGYMASRADAPVLAEDRAALAATLHEAKNAIYADIVRSGRIPLRGGVQALIQECLDSGVRMGIATTTSRSNVDALLRVHLGANWASCFAAVVCGEDVRHKKPDPEVYTRALQILRLAPHEVVAIEDSPIGAAAAHAAGIPVIVTRSAYFNAASVHGAMAIGPGLHSKQGWQPALDTRDAGHEPVRLADIESWVSGPGADKPIQA